MTQNEQKLFSFCQRQFDPSVTMEQLHSSDNNAMTIHSVWKMDKRVSVLCNETTDVPDGMITKLNHPNYSDMMLITLGWSDLYDVRFINMDAEVTHHIEGVYADMLFDTINSYLTIGILTKNAVEHLN